MAFNFSMLEQEPKPVGTTGQAQPGFNFSMLGGDPTPAPTAEPSLWERAKDLLMAAPDAVIPMGLRIGGTIGGAVAGGAISSPTVAGIPLGVIGGGAAGAGLGETAAEAYEKWRGLREDINPTQIATQTALGAVPVVGKAPTVARAMLSRGAQGAVMGGVSDVATRLAEGEQPTVGGALKGAALGGALGAGGGAIEARVARRLPASAPDGQFNFSMLDEGSVPVSKVDPDAAARLGPGAYAGPERRVTPRVAGPAKALEDVDYERVRQQQAQGVLKQNAARGQEKQALDDARAAAATTRGETPLPRGNAAEGPMFPPDPGRPARQAAKAGESIPSQQPLTEARKANDEVFLVHQPEPFREGLRDVLEENRHFEAQRRGVQPVERTNTLARYVQVERQKALPKGTALNAEELKAYADNLATTTDRIDELSKRIVAGEGGAADLAALEKARIEQHILLTNAMGARAETGRALNIHKQFAQIFESKDALALEQAMKIPGVNMEEVAKKLASLTTDTEKMDYLRSLQKHSPLDMVRSVYYANILSGVRTHIRNIFGNTINGAFNTASSVAATGYDLGRSTLTGQARTMYFGELQPRAVGAVMGVKQGIDDAMFTMKHGYTPKALGTFDTPRPELPGGAKNPFNLVGRTLEAEDQLFYGINYNSELYSRLYAKARGKGLTGDALVNQVADWKLAPPRDVAEAAEKAALRAVFKEDPGKIVSGVIGLKKAAPVLDFIMPFVKTPANILRQGIEATPLAPLTKQTREALKAGGREQAEAVGRMVTGTAALALAFWATQGKISGTGPTDPEKRAALMESGWRPNSVKIGDTWVSFSEIQPLAQPLYAIANAWEAYRDDGKVDPTEVMGAAARASLDQSFFSGLSDLNNALSDPDRYGKQFVQRVAQGFVPFSGLQRNIAQAMDTTVRQPKNVKEGVKSIVPGLSQTVDPKLDRLGKPVEREGGAAIQLTPFNIGRPSKDPVVQELTRLKVDSLGVPPKTLPATKTSPKIDLTIEERKRMGEAVRQELERLFARSNWDRMDEDRARELVSSAARRARTRVIGQIRRERR